MKLFSLNCSFAALAIGFVLAINTPTVSAHPDAALAKLTAAHGGQLRVAGPYHLELVLSDKASKVYVTDHAGTPQDMKMASVSATVLADGKITKLKLTFTGSNEFRSEQVLKPNPTTQVVVIVQPANQAAQQAKFAPFQAAPEHSHHDEKHTHDHEHKSEHAHDHEHKH